MNESILIVDDEPGIRSALSSILEDERFRTFTAEDAVLALEILAREAIDVIFLDVLLPRMGGMDALERIRKEWPAVEVVMISGHANVDMAVRAVKLGAFDFLEKPLSLDRVLTVCRNALRVRKLQEENIVLKKNVQKQKDELIGNSPEIEEVRALIRQAAASDAKILISGENGSGKELVARAIHRLSSRWDKPFVEVNCAAIPDTLIESELFGHERGAFTDAVSGRKGRFELANQGTLFLDEIGDMSPQAQAKVLTAIQEQKIERLGGEKTIAVDVRIVAATNKDLSEAIKEGRFREDLFFRLNVIPIHMPALRERKGDIPLLLFHFLNEFNGKGKVEFDDEAMAAVTAYPWPGNVRELRNFAERVAVMHQGGAVTLKKAAELLGKPLGEAPSALDSGQNGEDYRLPVEQLLAMNFNEAKEFFEKCYLTFQFSKNNGIITKTAEAIGIFPGNLHAKLRKYGIVRQQNQHKEQE